MSKKYYITNISYPYESSWDKVKNYVHMNIEDVDVSLINAIRRTIISSVDTIGVRTEPYDKCQIEILQNDTPLHNQFLNHRIGMIPINIPYPDKFKYEDYELFINVENDSSIPKSIYSNDIQIRRISTDSLLSESETRKIFPPDPVTNRFILITILKPKYFNSDVKTQSMTSSINNEKLKLYLKFKLSKSNGKENSRFNPSSCSVYENMLDLERANKGLSDYLIKERLYIKENNLTEHSDEELTARFNTSLKDRFFSVNKHGEPNKFIFKVETIGVIPPLIIFYRSLKSLKNKLLNFNSNLNKGTDIEIIPSNNLNNCFDFLIKYEDDTLGNLLQTEIINLFCNYNNKNNLVNYTAYVRPHPLKDEIKLTIQTIKKMDSSEIISSILTPSCQKVIKVLDNISSELEKSPQMISEIKKIN